MGMAELSRAVVVIGNDVTEERAKDFDNMTII